MSRVTIIHLRLLIFLALSAGTVALPRVDAQTASSGVRGKAGPLSQQEQSGSNSSIHEKKDFDVSGVVIHSLTGEPVAGTLVMISPVNHNDQLQTAFADTKGQFIFQGITPGKYRLRAKHKGFPSQNFEEHGLFFTAIAVGLNRDTRNVVFRLNPEASISGRISDDEDDSVRNAKVMLFAKDTDTGHGNTKLVAETTTNDQGAYEFGHLSAGTFFVGVVAHPWYARYVPQSSSGSGQTASANNADLDVAYPVTYYQQQTEAKQVTPITLHYGEHFRADVSLRAVPAVHMHLVSQSPEMSFGSEGPTLKQTLLGGAEVPIDPQVISVGPNALDLSGVAPGNYELLYDTTIDSWPEGSRQPNAGPRHQFINTSGNNTVNAAAGAEFATISGSIRFEGSGTVPPEASLRFRQMQTGQETQAPISSGAIQQINLGTGQYDVALLHAGGFALKSITSAQARTLGQSIEITTPTRVQLTVTASKGTGTIDGVALCNGQPLAGAMIVLVPEQAPENNLELFRREQTATDGTFEMSAVLPGRYTLLAVENGWNMDWASPTALRPYMRSGQSIQVAFNSRSSVTPACSPRS